MNRFILALVFLFSINIVFAQDGVFLFKTITLSFDEIDCKDSLISFELYQNDDFVKGKGYSQHFSVDSLTNVYQLSYSYQGIGGGSTPNYLECPVLFVKLNLMEIKEENGTNYFLLIPIIPSICSTIEDVEIEVLNINLNPIINQVGKVILIDQNGQYKWMDQSDVEGQLMIKRMLKIG